jgi:hypothetical protein
MTGLRLRRRVGGAAVAGLASSSAAANAGACDAKKAQALLGKSYSPRLEDRAVALSGASIAVLWGQGFVGTADYRTNRVDLWLDRKGNVESISCG